MRATLAALFALAFLGCGSDHNPFGGGGGPSGGGNEGQIDGGGGDGGSGDTLIVAGSLCEVLDLRQPSPCVNFPAGLEVSVLGQAQDADALGEFSFTLDERPDVIDITVDGGGSLYRSSYIRIDVPDDDDLDSLALPVLTDSSVVDIEVVLGESPTSASAIIVGFVSRSDATLSGASVGDPPVGTVGGTYYDSDSFPYVEVGAATGDGGVFAIFAAPVLDPTVSFTLKGTAAEAPQTVSARVEAGVLSFATFELGAP